MRATDPYLQLLAGPVLPFAETPPLLPPSPPDALVQGETTFVQVVKNIKKLLISNKKLQISKQN